MKFGRLRPDAFDLSREVATEYSELHIGLKSTGYISEIGNAVIFVGRARQLAGQYNFDVEEVVHILREEGVTKEELPSLAVVLHHQSEVPPDKQWLHGWHIEHQGVRLQSPADGEHVEFARALHLTVPAQDPDFIVKHEAGHLVAHITNTAGEILYDERRVSRLRRIGFGGLSIAIASEAAAVFAALKDAPAASVPMAIAGVLAGCGSVRVAKYARQILWELSSEEVKADQFAHKYHGRVVAGQGSAAGSSYFYVEPHEIMYGIPLNPYLTNASAKSVQE